MNEFLALRGSIEEFISSREFLTAVVLANLIFVFSLFIIMTVVVRRLDKLVLKLAEVDKSIRNTDLQIQRLYFIGLNGNKGNPK